MKKGLAHSKSSAHSKGSWTGGGLSLTTIAAGFLILTLAACVAGSGTTAANVPARPNIVLILADDLGYGDLSCQNPASKIQTPRLDRLASQGVRFTDAHAPSALCTPSRYSLLTGQNCWRSRLKSGVLNMWDEPLIEPDRLTVAGMLRNNGYRTACFGKWHLGLAWPFTGVVAMGFDTNVKPGDIDWTKRIGGGPVDCGFDYYFGINIPNQPPYAFMENDHVVGVPTVHYANVSGQQGHWGGPGVSGWDWTQVLPQITTNTVRWIQATCASGSQPFFLYASLVGPHQPVVPSRAFQGASRAGAYGDYAQELDWAVGQLLDALDSTGAATNTLVIFTSDNGPDEFAYQRLQQYQHASMGALRGIKSDIWEGGHRIPFLARWPQKIAGGTTNAQTICLVDFMSTAAEIVGAQLPSKAAEDSTSFLPTLLGTIKRPPTNRALILESGIGQFGIRSNNWMYIDSSTGDGHNPELEPLWFQETRSYVSGLRGPALLYNLETDLGEANNLLDQKTSIARQLQAQLRGRRGIANWSGGTSGDWSVAQNWAPARVPSGSDVVYSNLIGLANLTQTIGGTFDINSIGLDRSVETDVRITAATGGGLVVANGIDMWSASANLNIATPLALSQSQVWNVSSNHALKISGPLTIGSHGLTICGRGETIIANTISGSGWLRIRSSGTTVLERGNSFSGGTDLSGGGFLVAGNDDALGRGALVIPNDSTLDLAPGVTLTNQAVIQGYGAKYAGHQCGAITVRNVGVGAFNSDLSLSANTGFRANALGSVLSIGGTMRGDANVTIMPGAGIVIFSTNQLYAGKTIVEGRLKLAGGADRLPSGNKVVFADWDSAQLDLNDNDQTVESIWGGGLRGGNISLGHATLTVAPSRTAIYAGSISGTGNLEKAGSGTLMLDGLNSYKGRTRITDGALVVNGSLGGTEITVQGATLRGSGSIDGPVSIGDRGVLFAADNPSPLTVNNELLLGVSSTTRVELDSAQGRSGRVNGLTSVSYAGLLLISNVSPATAFTNGQSFRLFSSRSSTGTFSRIQPGPGRGLVWQFDPAKGVLRVIAHPSLQVGRSGANAHEISWPGQGFHLQVLTNSSGINATNTWFDYPGGWSSPVKIPIDQTQGSVFFRLVNP